MTIDDADFEEKADSPKRVTTDEGTVEERSIDELIKADKYTNARSVGNGPLHGIRVSRCKPGGAA